MIPVRKLIIAGDRDLAVTYRGFADSRLRRLKMDKKRRRLPVHSSTFRCDDGTVIECYSGSNNDDVVKITSPSRQFEEQFEQWWCFANTGMAQALITGIVDYAPVDSETNPSCMHDEITGLCVMSYPAGYYGTKTILYNLLVCTGHGSYVVYENVPSTDFTLHMIGSIVLVILTRTTDVPQPYIDRNSNTPCADIAFTEQLATVPDVIAIVPVQTGFPQYSREVVQ